MPRPRDIPVARISRGPLWRQNASIPLHGYVWLAMQPPCRLMRSEGSSALGKHIPVDLDGLIGDGFPAEVVARTLVARLPHLLG